jgi:hypothetical protein
MNKPFSHSAYLLFSHILIGWVACMAILIQYAAAL